jgi:hypothetical protein
MAFQKLTGTYVAAGGHFLDWSLLYYVKWKAVVPGFSKKTKHSLYVCLESLHMQQQNRNIKTMFIYNGIHTILTLTTIRVSQNGS